MDYVPLKPKHPYSSKVIVAICIFLLLDCSILAVNFWITRQVEHDALAINIAGRQRMLSQRLTKSLLLLQQDIQQQTAHMDELKQVFNLFTGTLDAFERGGPVTDGAGRQAVFTAVDDPEVLQLLQQTRELIQPLQEQIEHLIVGGVAPLELTRATLLARQQNLQILKLMNSLTLRMEQLSRQKTELIRWFQSSALILALVNFLIIVRLLFNRAREAQLQARYLLDLLDNAAACLLLLDGHGRIVMANRVGQECLGYSSEEFSSLALDQILLRRGQKLYARSRDGSRFRVEITERNIRLNEADFTVITLMDISRHADEFSRMAHLANHDALTGLVNRRALFDRLALELRHARRSGQMLGVFFIDLNKFKAVNDTLGHAAGDQLLVQVAQALKEAVRETDTVARYGGDEFILIMTGVEDPELLDTMEEKLQQVFDGTFLVQGKALQVGASIGRACYPTDGEDLVDLVQLADQQMFDRKNGEMSAELDWSPS